MEIRKNNSQNGMPANNMRSGTETDCRKNSFLLLNNYRGAIMGLSAIWIYIFHEWIPLFDEHHLRLSKIELFIKQIGFCGVDILLFLSGIGLTYSIAKAKSIPAFYYRRMKRVLLPFLLMAVLRGYVEEWSIEEFLGNISGFHFIRYNVYSFLWYVPAICILYLLFPLYYKLFLKASHKVSFTMCALLLWLMSTLYVRDDMRWDLFGFTNRIPIFLIGILVGWYAQNKEILFDRLTWILLGLIFVLGLYLAYLSTFEGMYILVPVSNCCIPGIMIAFSASFLFAGFMNLLCQIRYTRFLENIIFSVLSFYGLFSLELYCVQEWLGEYLFPRMSLHYGAAAINAVLFPLATITGLILYRITKYFCMLLDWAVPKLSSVRLHFTKEMTD